MMGNNIGKFQFQNDEENNVTILKQSNKECVLHCIPKRSPFSFIGLVGVLCFSASFRFTLESFRVSSNECANTSKLSNK